MPFAQIRSILAEINRPSAQKDSWFGWASAQLAHAMIGAALAGGLVFILPPAAALFLVVVGYAALKEVPDFCRAPSWAAARDCVQDALFVTAGAALAVAIAGGHETLFLVAVLGAAIGLALGVIRRPPGLGGNAD